MIMLLFLYLFLFRALSGVQNGFGYADRKILRTITTLIMGLALMGTLFWIFYYPPESYWKVASIFLVLASIVGVLGVEDSFNDNYQILPKDVHLWEILATGGVTLAWVTLGGNLISIAASIYPGLILHKGFINLGSGKTWWYHGTDDPSGQTYSIPLLGIKIPRLSTRGRISIAVASLMAVIINSSLQWEISVQKILSWL